MTKNWTNINFLLSYAVRRKSEALPDGHRTVKAVERPRLDAGWLPADWQFKKAECMSPKLLGARKFCASILFWLSVFSLHAACSSKPADEEDRKPVFPVKGKVLVGNKPAASAFLLFVPVNEPAESKDPRPRAEVQPDGSFALSTYGEEDGAPAGDYIVTLTWPDEEQSDRLKGRFSDPTKSKLRAKVKPEPNDLPFLLK